MHLLFILSFLIGHPKTPVEIWDTYGLSYLYIESKDVFVVKPLSYTFEDNTVMGRTYHFKLLITNVLKSNEVRNSYTIDSYINGYDFDEMFEKYGNIDTFLMFGHYHEFIFYPTSSGIRPFKNDTLFLPIQYNNPGIYEFKPKPNNSLSDCLSKVYKIKSRVDSFLNLQKIRDFNYRNQVLFDWINEHSFEMKDFTEPDSTEMWVFNTKWGSLSNDIFEWINTSGIWEDAWKGMLLSKKILGNSVNEPYFEMLKSFTNPEARGFLMDVIQNDTLLENKKRAFEMLPSTLWNVEHYDELRNETPMYLEDSTEINATEQEKILLFAQPFLWDKNLYGEALRLIEKASLPWSNEDLLNRYNFMALPELELKLAQTQTNDKDFILQLTTLISNMKVENEYFKKQKN
jgi:hypothetical protein